MSHVWDRKRPRLGRPVTFLYIQGHNAARDFIAYAYMTIPRQLLAMCVFRHQVKCHARPTVNAAASLFLLKPADPRHGFTFPYT